MAQWNSGSRGSFGGHGDRWGSSSSGNDGLTWKKGMEDKTLEKGEETTSPTKTPLMPPRDKSPAKMALLLQTNDPNFLAAIDGGGAANDMRRVGRKVEKMESSSSWTKLGQRREMVGRGRILRK